MVRRPSPGSRIIATDSDVARGVRALRRRCAIMRRVHDVTGDPPLRRRAPGFEGLARIVVGQQVSVASANAIWARCAATIEPMTADRLARLSSEELRACGLSRPKIRTLQALADAVVSAHLHLEADREGLRDELLAVHGIGPWTADVFELFCLGRQDAFAPGDLALQTAARHAFELDERPSAAELTEFAEAWHPWRGVSARLLWAYYAVIRQGRDGIAL